MITSSVREVSKRPISFQLQTIVTIEARENHGRKINKQTTYGQELGEVEAVDTILWEEIIINKG